MKLIQYEGYYNYMYDGAYEVLREIIKLMMVGIGRLVGDIKFMGKKAISIKIAS